MSLSAIHTYRCLLLKTNGVKVGFLCDFFLDFMDFGELKVLKAST